MKNKAKLIGYVLGIIVFLSLLIGATYAFYRKTLYTVDIDSTSSNLEDYIIYSKGVNVNGGTLNPTVNYLDGVSATVTFYLSNDCPYNLYGHIYFDINSISESLVSSEALKYTVINNSSGAVIGNGSFSGKSASLLTAYNIPLSTQRSTYTVYIWLDEDFYDNTLTDTSFDIDIRCQATMKQFPGIAASYITNLYLNNKDADTVTNGGVQYQTASSVYLMNDRLGGSTVSLDGGNVRYVGSNIEVNNFAWLGGTYISGEKSYKKRWRIIGVFDGRLKLLSTRALPEVSFDTSASDVNNGYGINQWGPSVHTSDGSVYEGADLMRLLNPGYENESVNNSLYWNSGTGTVYIDYNNTTKADVSFVISGLSPIERDMIDTVTWYLGAYSDETDVNVLYNHERQGTKFGNDCSQINSYCNDDVVRTGSWEGMVGLPYLSDIAYAVDLRQCNFTLTTQYKANHLCSYYNWMSGLYGVYDAFTITPFAKKNYATRLSTAILTSALNTPKFDAGWTDAKEKSSRIYTTIYLKPEVMICGGNGTSTDPYTLCLQ